MSSPFKGWAAILVWKLSSFTTFHAVLVGKEILSVLPLSVFRSSLWFLTEFQFCSCKMLTLYSECNLPQTSSCSWGYGQKGLGCRAAFYAWHSDGRFYRFPFPLCCWKCLGTCAQLLLILYLWEEGLWHAVTHWFPISTDQFHTDLPHFHTREFWHADPCKDLFLGKYWSTPASASIGTWSHYCVHYSCSGQG